MFGLKRHTQLDIRACNWPGGNDVSSLIDPDWAAACIFGAWHLVGLLAVSTVWYRSTTCTSQVLRRVALACISHLLCTRAACLLCVNNTSPLPLLELTLKFEMICRKRLQLTFLTHDFIFRQRLVDGWVTLIIPLLIIWFHLDCFPVHFFVWLVVQYSFTQWPSRILYIELTVVATVCSNVKINHRVCIEYHVSIAQWQMFHRSVVSRHKTAEPHFTV
jgi:hypothetical protein